MRARDEIEERARALGFHHFGVCAADPPPPELDRFRDWLARERQGEMAWIERGADQRLDVSLLLRGVSSILVAALRYAPPQAPDSTGLAGEIAAYARGEDYHRTVGEKAARLAGFVRERFSVRAAEYVDTGPVLERLWAARAGVGWIGKNALVLFPRGDPHRSGSSLRRARRRSVRIVLAVRRGLPDGSDRRGPRRRQPALSLVPHDRAARDLPGRASRGARDAPLRLRRLPDGVPVESRRCGEVQRCRARSHRDPHHDARRLHAALPRQRDEAGDVPRSETQRRDRARKPAGREIEPEGKATCVRRRSGASDRGAGGGGGGSSGLRRGSGEVGVGRNDEGPLSVPLTEEARPDVSRRASSGTRRSPRVAPR